ncbi:hypothetical protein H6F51_23860 [Cyanobacteria bacterium FACHB-DQ100]|nr:hypothetical protein [Cyanobacteria bacterium FACHB-DQ100]
MHNLNALPRDNWLMIPCDTTRISLDLVCRQVVLDDYLDEEIDAYCTHEQVREFFYKDQIEDICDNLAAQRPKYSDAELESAINYYWQYDAFIDFTSAADSNDVK